MIFILREETKTTISELSRRPNSVFERSKRYGYVYLMKNSTPMGIFISSKKFASMEEVFNLQYFEKAILHEYLKDKMDDKTYQEVVESISMLQY